MTFTFTTQILKKPNQIFAKITSILLGVLFSGMLYGSCFYTLEMFDSFGDGWNGSMLTISVDGVPVIYTLAGGESFGRECFEVEDGASVVIGYAPGNFENEVSYQIYDGESNPFFGDGPFPMTGVTFNDIGGCPDCSTPNPCSIEFSDVTDTSAVISWEGGTDAESFILEFGPSGFPQGFGVMMSSEGAPDTLMGLNPCVNYDVYIHSICSNTSTVIGPFEVTTDFDYGPPGAPCVYTLEMFSASGFGWNGASMSVIIDGVETIYDLFFGAEAIFELEAFENQPIIISYIPGFFDFDNSFNVIDPSGNVIVQTDPPPSAGEVLNVVACTSCPAPFSAMLYEVNADNAKLTWSPAPSSAGSYIVEYGSLGFTRGTGTMLSVDAPSKEVMFSGLTENTYYDAYVYLDCGSGDVSKPVGPVTFRTRWFDDVGIANISNPDAMNTCNLSTQETVTLTIANFGQLPQTLFNFRYAVNGQVAPIPIPTDGFFTGVIGNDSLITLDFETTFDFSAPGYYLIEAWTELEGDQDMSNDTFSVEVITAFPKPLMEDFESQVFPNNWTTNAFNPIFAPNSHNNESTILGQNLFAGNTEWETMTHRVGLVLAGDMLSFDYRYVNWFDGTTAANIGTGDELDIQISTDCGDSFETIFTVNSTNHVSSVNMATVQVDLSPFAGDAINIRFLATWGTGDYWLDIDNINLLGCPDNLGLFNSDVIPASNGNANGVIAVKPLFGTPPYAYQWNIGSEEGTITGLEPGVYTVTVVDAMGCQDETFFEIGSIVGTEELVSVEKLLVSPNPTTGRAFLEMELSEVTDMQIRLFNLNGQLLQEVEVKNATTFNHEFDLSAYTNGMYLLQIQMPEQVHYEKLILAK